jgi:hypothetical protein
MPSLSIRRRRSGLIAWRRERFSPQEISAAFNLDTLLHVQNETEICICRGLDCELQNLMQLRVCANQ